MQKKRRDHIKEGEQAYQAWRDALLGDPEAREIYIEEAAKKELWLQLVEARQAAGLTQVELARRLGVSQAQVARIEKSGYDSYTLNTLRRYVQALGKRLEVSAILVFGSVATGHVKLTSAQNRRHRV
jgi:DNA-binding XRE family transcriptional regulator